MRVWRIECPDTRVGPFKSWRPNKADWSKNDAVGHSPYDGPDPKQDCGRWPIDQEVCVCTSLQQLDKWFHGPHYAVLGRAGYVLGEYEVSSVGVEGRRQALVFRSALKHIADHAIPTMEAPREEACS